MKDKKKDSCKLKQIFGNANKHMKNVILVEKPGLSTSNPGHNFDMNKTTTLELDTWLLQKLKKMSLGCSIKEIKRK